MWDVAFELLVILGLAVLNGLFAMSEIAIVSARKARLQHRAEEGDPLSQAALDLALSPDRFLATVQVGITLVGILAGAFGGATLAQRLHTQMATIPWLAPHAHWLALTLVVALVTFLSVVVGELVPKNLALVNPERVARRVARPMQIISQLGAPLVTLFRLASRPLLWAFGVKSAVQSPVTEEEIRIMLAQGAQAGVFEQTERTLVERVFRLDDRRVGSLMTPRTEIVWIDRKAPLGESMRAMSATGHTYFPLCDGSIDNVLGMVSIKDQWRRMLHKQVPDLLVTLVQVPYVPETMTALQLLNTFKKAGRHIALVVDEYGGLSGLVTLNDALGAIVGEIPSGAPGESASIVRREDGSYLLDGMVAVDELEHLVEIELPEDGDYETIAGFCLDQLGHIPRVGEYFTWSGLRFEIVDMDGHRVDRVLMTPHIRHDSDGHPHASESPDAAVGPTATTSDADQEFDI